jgi:hypothetical protein
MLSEVLVIDASDFATERDCDAILAKHGYIVNDQHVSIDLAEKVAAFRDLLVDCGDCYDDLSHTERLESCRLLLGQVHEIEATGYRTKYAVYTTADQFQVSVVVFLPKTEERLSNMSQLVVPRNFAKAARW